MKITKQHLDEMYRCYCASYTHIDGELKIFLASEEKGYPCYSYSGTNFEKKEVVWEDGGGTMSIIPIPNKPNEFFAVKDFYLKVSPSEAKIVWGKYEDGKWTIQDVLYLPYLHRFDIYHVDGVNYFIGATIAESKENKEDWSKPGKIYVATLPEDLSEPFELEELAGGLYKNHGYTRHIERGYPVGYFGSDEGILKVSPPRKKGEAWKTEKIMDGTISEVAIVDIDNDGQDEIMTIEPFHGNAIHIYKKIKNTYQKVYTYENEIDFAHTLVGCTLRGVNTFLAGVRRKDAEIFYVQYHNGEFVTRIIEKGAGPANLAVVNEKDRDIIIAANHTLNEAAVYYVEDETC